VDANDVTLELYNGATYDAFARVVGDALNTKFIKTFEIPTNLLSGMHDANGEAIVRINVAEATGGTGWVFFIKLEVDVTTTGYATAISITDGETYRLTTGTDLSADATKVWDGCPYCIAKEIYLHFEAATGPILGGDGIVTLTCGAANVENTSGFSTRQYKEATRLRIAQDLAAQDKSVFWITLGGTTVTYKQTFGADTMQLTDGTVDDWQSLYDYNQMVNEYHVYGGRIGEAEVFQSQGNAASILKYKATRSKVIRDAGIVSDTHAKDIGTALAARDAEISQMVGCTIAGNTATAAHATTIKLGEIVEITSSYLWPAAAAKDYVVTRFAYDSTQHKTYLTLHPKSSIGYQEIDALHSKGQKMEEDTDRLKTDAYVADPVSHDVS
jgi:hypothetical protein